MGAPGWDDAPPAALERAASIPHKYVTLIWPYYENPAFLGYQLARLIGLPPQLQRHLRLIIVDDCSPKPAAPVLRAVRRMPIPTRLLRIEVDVRWNWLAARNLGMSQVTDGWSGFARGVPPWCALTDIDHVWPAATLENLIWQLHEPGTIYRFQRREADGRRIHIHPNSFFIEPDTFWKVGGYDEALSGHYGTDGDWRRRCAAVAPIRTLPDFIERHEYEGDSSTLTYLRKQPIDAGKKAIIAKRKGVKNWRPKVLSFPWHEVQL